MAIARALNNNGDWTFGRGKSSYLKNDSSVKQNLETRLLEYKDDWFNNEDKGIDYNYYLSSKGTREDLENAIRFTILETEDVVEITSFYTEFQGRQLTIVFEAKTIYNTILSINTSL